MAKRTKVTRKDKKGRTTFAELKAQEKRRGIEEVKEPKPKSLEELSEIVSELLDFIARETNFHGERMYVAGQLDAVYKARMGADLMGGGMVSLLGGVFEPDPRGLDLKDDRNWERPRPRPRPKTMRMPHGHEDDDVD